MSKSVQNVKVVVHTQPPMKASGFGAPICGVYTLRVFLPSPGSPGLATERPTGKKLTIHPCANTVSAVSILTTLMYLPWLTAKTTLVGYWHGGSHCVILSCQS